jgi:hypothetical protein
MRGSADSDQFRVAIAIQVSADHILDGDLAGLQESSFPTTISLPIVKSYTATMRGSVIAHSDG